MASSVVSGTSDNPRGYSVRTSAGSTKPKSTSYSFNDEETKINFSCANGSLFLKISSVLMVVSCVLQIIAIGAPFWAAGWRRSKMSWHEGVWMTCYRTEQENKWICGAYDYKNDRPGVPTWYAAVQAMALISLVVYFPGLIINFFYTMHPRDAMFRGLMWFNMALTFVSAILPIAMIVVYAAGHPKRDRFPVPYLDMDYDDTPYSFHFCFAFEFFIAAAAIGALVLEILDYIKN